MKKKYIVVALESKRTFNYREIISNDFQNLGSFDELSEAESCYLENHENFGRIGIIEIQI